MPSCTEFCAGSDICCITSFGGSLGPTQTLLGDTDQVVVGVTIKYSLPTNIVPGSVYGITEIYCALAIDVVNNKNSSKVITIDTTIPDGALSYTYMVPPQYALSYAVVQIGLLQKTLISNGGLGLGIQQIQFISRKFADKSVDTNSSALFPPTILSGQTLSQVNVGCTGNNLFVRGISWNVVSTSGDNGIYNRMGQLQFSCYDYTSVISLTEYFVGCCAGKNTWGCNKYIPQSTDCDAYISDYCKSHSEYLLCGCINSPVSNPECIDVRCANSTVAYRTNDMNIKGGCDNIETTCLDYTLLDDGKYLAHGKQPPLNCTTNTLNYIYFGIIILVILIALVLSSHHTKLPPTELPHLPDITQF
jgi:hypothetical protein